MKWGRWSMSALCAAAALMAMNVAFGQTSSSAPKAAGAATKQAQTATPASRLAQSILAIGAGAPVSQFTVAGARRSLPMITWQAAEEDPAGMSVRGSIGGFSAAISDGFALGPSIVGLKDARERGDPLAASKSSITNAVVALGARVEPYACFQDRGGANSAIEDAYLVRPSAGRPFVVVFHSRSQSQADQPYMAYVYFGRTPPTLRQLEDGIYGGAAPRARCRS